MAGQCAAHALCGCCRCTDRSGADTRIKLLTPLQGPPKGFSGLKAHKLASFEGKVVLPYMLSCTPSWCLLMQAEISLRLRVSELLQHAKIIASEPLSNPWLRAAILALGIPACYNALLFCSVIGCCDELLQHLQLLCGAAV